MPKEKSTKPKMRSTEKKDRSMWAKMLRDFRNRIGFTQEELATRLLDIDLNSYNEGKGGKLVLSHSDINRLENDRSDRRKLTPDIVFGFAEAFLQSFTKLTPDDERRIFEDEILKWIEQTRYRPTDKEIYAIFRRQVIFPPLKSEVASAIQTEQGVSILPTKLLIGRQAEWTKIQQVWQDVQRNGARFIIIQGESGLGKTYLAEVFHQEIAHTVHTLWTAYRESEIQNNQYQLMRKWLTKSMNEIYHHLNELECNAVERLISGTKTIRLEEGEVNFREQLARAFMKEKFPFVLFIDDLQWCDIPTIALLRLLLDEGKEKKLLVIGTLRPRQLGPELNTLLNDLAKSEQLEIIELKAFKQAETKELAEYYLGRELSADESITYFNLSQGNPFWVRYVDESTWNNTAQRIVLRDLHNATDDERYLSNLIAIGDQSFSIELLVVATKWDKDRVLKTLKELWRREVVNKIVSNENENDFRHKFIQQAILEFIPPSDKYELHLQLAHAIETIYATELHKFISQIAKHYGAAGKPIPRSRSIIEAYFQAGKIERKKFNQEQAILYFEAGLELLNNTNDMPKLEKQKFELELLISLGLTKVITQGNAAKEVGRIFQDATVLWNQVREYALLFPLIWGLGSHYMIRGSLQEAYIWGQTCLKTVQEIQNPRFLLEVHCLLGLTAFYQGRFIDAKDHLLEGCRLYDPARDQQYVLEHAQDTGILCQSYMSIVEWFLGFSDKAYEQAHRALEFAPDEAIDPNSRAVVYFTVIWVYYLLGKPQAGIPLCDILLGITNKHKLPLFGVLGQMFKHKFEFDQHQDAETLIKLYEVGEIYRKAGTGLALNYWHQLMANAYMKLNEIEEGVKLLQPALKSVEEGEEQTWLAELYRLRGEQALLLLPTNLSDAERDFNRAIQVAYVQSAKILEIRAVTSLCKLWKIQGKYKEAYDKLSSIYNQFTEGFDTPDLQTAKALLDELST
ncbi:MAG: AAA family ATPase [Caldilineaceae bacterium]